MCTDVTNALNRVNHKILIHYVTESGLQLGHHLHLSIYVDDIAFCASSTNFPMFTDD